MDFVNLRDVEEAARERLSPAAFDYYAGGAGDEITVRENLRAYAETALRYRVLRDVGHRDLSTTVLGARVSMPVLVAPMAFQRLACPEGEIATARGAAAMGSLMILSTFSNAALEEVRAATSAPLWYQLYVFKDRGATRALVERVEKAGFQGLVLTVDAPFLGQRERDLRNAFQLPSDVPVAALMGGRTPPAPGNDLGRDADAGRGIPPQPSLGSDLADYFRRMLDPSLTWRDVEWLRSIARLPVLVKGIIRGDDAVLALEHGAAGVIVSNHGGRQLDTAPATIRALPEIVDALAGRAEILVDGGVRRGTDVIKAMALGARAVLVGRPVIWGLAVKGERGVAHVLELLRDELDLAMALCGCSSVQDITHDLVAAPRYH